MRLNKYDNEEKLSLIYKSESLTKSFEKYVRDMETNYINEVFGMLEGCTVEVGCRGVGASVRVLDTEKFIGSVERVLANYPISEYAEKKVTQCRRLERIGSGLYRYHVRKLGEVLAGRLNEMTAAIFNKSSRIMDHMIYDELCDYVECFGDALGELVDVDENDKMKMIIELN